MSQPSFIPGYKKLTTETLYRPQEEYAFVNDIKTTVIPQSPNIMIEKNGPFMSAYYQQYESNTPYKNGVYTPSLFSSNNVLSTHKPCNPLVTYPFGVPQDVVNEKCTKCKGNKKCHNKCHNKKKGLNKKNENVKDLDLFTCKLRPEEDSEEIKENVETDINNKEECEQCKCANINSCVSQSQISSNHEMCNHCNKINKQVNNETDGNNKKCCYNVDSLFSPHICNNNMITESDIMQSTFTYSTCDDFPLKEFQEKSEIFGNQEYMLINNMNSCENETGFSATDIEGEMTYQNEKVNAKLNDEDVNEQLNVHDNVEDVNIVKIVDGFYDLDFNPFEEEFDAEKADLYKKRIEGKGEFKTEENRTDDVTTTDAEQNIPKIQVKINKDSSSKKDLEEEVSEEETSPKKNMNKKNSKNIHNASSDEKINDENQTKYIRKSTTNNEISNKKKSKKVDHVEHLIEEEIENEEGSKFRVDLKETHKISMTNTDDLFSLISPRHIGKTPIKEHKSASKNELKLKPSKKLHLNTSGVLDSTKKNFIRLNKNLNESKKKGLLTETLATDSVMKKTSASPFIKNKKALNKNKTKENTGNISTMSAKSEIETGRTTTKPILNGSTKKSYGKNKIVTLKNSSVKKINSNVRGVSKNKGLVNKNKESEITDSSKKTNIMKNEKANAFPLKKNTSTVAREAVAKKLKSKKKELYTKILSLTENIKENAALKKKNEEIKN